MSAKPPQSRGGVQAVPLAAGRYATQGMIGTDGFVDAAGSLTPVAFRFLNSLYQISAGGALLGTEFAGLQATLQELAARLDAIEARLPPP